MAKILRDLVIDEVSLVDKGANTGARVVLRCAAAVRPIRPPICRRIARRATTATADRAVALQ